MTYGLAYHHSDLSLSTAFAATLTCVCGLDYPFTLQPKGCLGGSRLVSAPSEVISD